MISPRGVVMRLEFEPVIRTLWLRREDALMVEREWVWVEEPDDAFVFEAQDNLTGYEVACAVAKHLAANGEKHVNPMVHEERRRSDRRGRLHASVQQEQHEERLRRHRQILERMRID